MFTGFLGFPCPYLPGKETPWQNSIISPIFQQHFSTNRRNSIQTRKLLYFHAKLGYYHGNSRLLPDSTIFSPIAILSAASKTKKSGAHHPPWWTPPSLKTLDFKPFFNTFACEYPNSYGIIFLLPPVPLLDYDDFYPGVKMFTPFTPPVRNLPHPIRHSTNRQIKPLPLYGIRYRMI